MSLFQRQKGRGSADPAPILGAWNVRGFLQEEGPHQAGIGVVPHPAGLASSQKSFKWVLVPLWEGCTIQYRAGHWHPEDVNVNSDSIVGQPCQGA
jgi:hypothetical protein